MVLSHQLEKKSNKAQINLIYLYIHLRPISRGLASKHSIICAELLDKIKKFMIMDR